MKFKARLAGSSKALLAQLGSAPRLSALWCSIDPSDNYLVQIVDSDQLFLPSRPRARYLRRRGVNLRHLRPLTRASLTTAAPVFDPVKMGLVNARSVVNKTFIIKDFLISHELDFLCLTETWMAPGEASAFSELLPKDYMYFNTPRCSGRGGGLAIVFKSNFTCKQLFPPVSYPSFERSSLPRCSVWWSTVHQNITRNF